MPAPEVLVQWLRTDVCKDFMPWTCAPLTGASPVYQKIVALAARGSGGPLGLSRRGAAAIPAGRSGEPRLCQAGSALPNAGVSKPDPRQALLAGRWRRGMVFSLRSDEGG
jgi:hypothetical protein